MKKIDKTENLTKILSHRRFTVDVFQREYRWGRKQIEQMLSDFQNTFEEFYDPDKHDMIMSRMVDTFFARNFQAACFRAA